MLRYSQKLYILASKIVLTWGLVLCFPWSVAGATFADGLLHTISDDTYASDFVVLSDGTELAVTGDAKIGANAFQQSVIASDSVVTISSGVISGGLEIVDGTNLVLQGGTVGVDHVLRSVSATSSTINVSGGTLDGTLTAIGGSTITVSGGTLTAKLYASGNSSVVISGGHLDEVHVVHSELKIDGDTMRLVEASFDNEVEIRGGTVNGPFSMHGGNTAVISGGSIGVSPISGYSVNGFEHNTITITGGVTDSSVDVVCENWLTIEDGVIGANAFGNSINLFGINNVLSISGGALTGGIQVDAFGELDITGGTIGSDLEQVSIDAAAGIFDITNTTLGGAIHADGGNMTLRSGTFGSDKDGVTLLATGHSQFNILGGMFTGQLNSLETSTLNLYGDQFAIDGVPIGFGPVNALSGQLTARLSDGALLSVSFRRDETAMITAVEPVPITPRTIDGSNNNVTQPTWGQTDTEEIRLTPVDYADGIATIRTDTHGRPNTREISTRIFSQSATTPILDENHLNEMVWAWGQFVDHDIDFTQDGTESHQVDIPLTDPDFAFDSDGIIRLPRKAFKVGSGKSVTNPRQFNNDITTWVDASLVYGSDATRASALRTHAGTGAHLRTHEFGDPATAQDDLLPTAQDLIDAGVSVPSMLMASNPRMADNVRFIVGDVRANENTAILALHTLMVREHNRIVDVLTLADSGLSDEDKYQIARKVVGAEMQAVTYQEYLPAIGVDVDTSGGYDVDVNPSISTEFAHAVFRMGHTSINEQALRLNHDLTPHVAGPVTLEDTFFNPMEVFDTGGIEPFLLGLISNVQEATDAKMVPGLRNGLFQMGPTSMIHDLAAIDIERGRDIGIGDYNEVRQAFGLSAVTDFADITSDATLQAALSDLYGGDVNDIDLFVGMLAEDHLPGVASGITVQTVLADQFERLAVGDRFFYEWDADLAMIESIYGISVLDRLTEIMLANTDIPSSSITNTDNVFIAQESVPEPCTFVLSILCLLWLTAFSRRQSTA